MDVLGIDIGGTGIKGAPVDTTTGELKTERFRIETPQPATPEAVVEVVAQVAAHFEWKGPIGCGFPAVIKHGVVHTAANIDPTWIGIHVEDRIREATGASAVRVLNDADAAGIAEMKYGAGKGEDGVVIMVTLGTGIGCAVFHKGVLLPNTELGHLEIRGKDAERRASEAARERKDLSWDAWGRNVEEYLKTLERLLWPDLIILGGGVSRQSGKFLPFVEIRTRLVVAELLNNAGTAGAALAAAGDAAAG
jgi:polyphosphate glucokinase